ncbi:hypothetical protein, variant [Verruconis gallopava]|uniref:BAR domain-containing protein n=1 Tax=Verruconis gallopava TaxID=253628 RepID=A0A0D2AHE8_9PEZI|nr:hypothetical protein, variant [Verruconis gallopava]KIW05975.1 hypothetical protein, variant [Verruconis gallopava]
MWDRVPIGVPKLAEDWGGSKHLTTDLNAATHPEETIASSTLTLDKSCTAIANMDKVQSFWKSSTSGVLPGLARMQQSVKEQLGQADDKTEMPDEYIKLEKRVDALKQVHQKMLQVTSQYTNEAYDYPSNLRESFNDLGRTVSEKVTLLGQASSPAEAAAAMTAPPQAKPQPKTFNHAMARAALSASHTLNSAPHDGQEDPLATALEKFAIAEEKIGEARLAQDSAIQARYLAGWSTTLNTQIKFATNARRNVENARLSLDATKSKIKSGPGISLPGSHRESISDEDLTDAQRAEIEAKEDEFVAQTEEAVGVFKNVLDTPEPLRNLAELIAAQLEFHKKAYEILSELSPVVDQLQTEQEVSRHQPFSV